MTDSILLVCIFILSFAHAEPQLEKLKLPPGYKISLYAYPVENARSLTQGPDGIVFVGSRKSSNVYALLPDRNGDGRADSIVKIGEDLNSPNGVAYRNGDLYVAEIDRILVYRGIAKNLEKAPKPEAWGPEFPKDSLHGWKFIAFGPDGWLYVPVGAPCNICEPDARRYAAIFRVSPDGKKRERIAHGVRNTVGFDWHPNTKQLWFTDNGRDYMGDDKPPCELNRLTKSDQNFGYPYCHGSTHLDPQFGKSKSCSKFVPPIHEFPAHSAPLGMRFITRSKTLKNSILVAEHGSWNRSRPIGYQVSRIQIDPDSKIKSSINLATKSEPFLSGFLQGEEAWGRPVDILELADGSILISDDYAGAIYRIN